jgi:hypothetical protein
MPDADDSWKDVQMPECELSKSRYLSGLQCDRRLWLDTFKPSDAVPPSEAQRHIFRMSTEVGEAARKLFPDGVLVEAPSFEHGLAVEQTREFIADGFASAIFEAAFEFGGVQVRVDILERLAGDSPRFGIREVKSSTCVKGTQHVPGLAIQKWVLEGCGLSIGSTELVHLDADFVRGEGSIEWARIFKRVELIDRLGPAEMENVAARVDGMRETIALSAPPEREPGPKCRRPHLCPFWDSCTAAKPGTWFIEQGGANEERKAIMVEVTKSQQPWISESLEEDLGSLPPPFWALDFEAIGAAIPLFDGTRPYQPIPFQWSLHRLSKDGRLDLVQFLASGRTDPREEVAKELVGTLQQDTAPILVYSGYGQRRLKELAAVLPEFESSLLAIVDRLVDLLPIVRRNVYHPDFLGSYSIKYVAPALSPSLTFTDLVGVADGTTAMGAFARLVSRESSPHDEAVLRSAMLEYSERDTLALVDLYRSLGERVGQGQSSPGHYEGVE